MRYWEEIFYSEGVRHWNRLPRQTVGVPILASVQAQAGEGFEQSVLVGHTLPMAGGLGLDALRGPFQPLTFMVLRARGEQYCLQCLY